MIFQLGKTDVERRMVVNSTGRKWEFTFTTLVTFWRSLLCFVPIVLFYQLRFGLLGVDYHSFLVHNSGC